jgi:signal transduction histidine kinase
VKLRTQILLLLFVFGLAPLLAAVIINLPFVLDRMQLFYHKAHLQNLRADFRILDQHLARRNEMARVLSKLPEPGIISAKSSQDSDFNLDKERARYTNWVNRLLSNMNDISQVLFIDEKGQPQFWLSRSPQESMLIPTVQPPLLPSPELIEAVLEEKMDTVLVSPLSIPVNGDKQPPYLHIVAPVTLQTSNTPVGAAIITLAISSMAGGYQDMLWVLDDGRYLDEQGHLQQDSNAFKDHPGLAELFARRQLSLWENGRRQIIWLPMFPTETKGALWVGRAVDPSPLASFSLSLSWRVLLIIGVLILLTFLAAHLVARRAARIGLQITEGLRQMVEHNEPLVFDWRKPSELRRFGENLTALGRKHHENLSRLHAHAQALEMSNRYKSEFLANVSHELRTPLNSILLLSRMLADDPELKNQESRQRARVIHEAGSNLKNLIDNILDMSRIEAGRAALNIQPIELPSLLAEIQAIMAPQFQAKKLVLDLIIEPGSPPELHSDPDKIAQIIRNFLSNSVKFTERGGASLRLHTKRPEQRYPVCISVEDSGIGIDPANQARIFAAFQQADGSTSRRYGGSGLGLTISRQLAQLLGGDIILVSSLDQGARFTLGLPDIFDPSQVMEKSVSHQPLDLTAPETVAVPEGSFQGQRILLLDDDLDSLLRLTPLLRGWNLEVCAATDFEEALEALGEPDRPCHLLIVNMALDTLHGRIQAIKEGLPILLLARDSGQELTEADLVLDPAFDPQALHQAIATLLDANRT